MKYSLAFHIVGFILWTGGLMFITRVMSAATSEAQESEVITKTRAIVKRSFFGYVVAGLAIVTISGMYQLSQAAKFYMAQSWIHWKFTAVIALFIVTFICARQVFRFSSGAVMSRKTLGALHGITMLCMVSIVFLTMLGR